VVAVKFAVVGEGKVAERTQEYINRYAPAMLFASPGALAFVEYDYLISINNTHIIPKEYLLNAKLALNMHPAPLPEYAGLYCHYWALENGEDEFGATVHVMTPNVDGGDIVAQKRFMVDGSDAKELFIRSMSVGYRLMCGVINDIIWERELIFDEQDLSNRKLYTLEMAQEAGWLKH
jgi:methionyl-tRNA formyltransferase